MSIKQTIYAALTGEYWKNNGYSTRRMAQAAAKVANVAQPDLNALERIIVRNLVGPNFVTMTKEVKRALAAVESTGEFTVELKHTHHHFVVSESATGGWGWESFASSRLGDCLDCSKLFEFAEEAYQDAIRHAREQEQEWVDGREEREAAIMADLSMEQRIEDRQNAARRQ
jgi:hypothetical protein